MTLFPGVRSKEFQNLFFRQPLSEDETIIDCPALGRYLASNLSTRVHVKSLDFCPQENGVELLSEFKPSVKYDRVVCLAASHHIENISDFLGQLSTSLKVGGYFHIADVDSQSPISSFLDEFVGKWTSTGHRGIWRNLNELLESNPVENLKVLRAEVRECPWIFKTQEQMLEFCRLLFGLDLNPSDDQILGALRDFVGVEITRKSCKILWKLSYVDLVKNV
jgi:hypothetical protein